MGREKRSQPVVGILLGGVFDDWLEELGMSLDAFSNQMMGSWVFNYIQALQTVGVLPILFCVSTQVSAPTRLTHRPTGATIFVLPQPKTYRKVRQWLPKHLDSSTGHVLPGFRGGLMKLAQKTINFSMSYLSTPVIVLFREIRREGCRSLLVQEYESARFDLCVLMGRIKQVQVFATFTGGTATHWLSRPLRRLALGLCAGLAIGARSEAERVRAQYRFPEQAVSLIYSPVDLGIFYPSPRDECRNSLGIPSHVKLAIYHGRIDLRYKGLDVLLEAWKLLCQANRDEMLQLLVIGTGPDAEEFQHLLSRKQLHGVEWLNRWIHDRSLIRRYLSSADVYVFPSRGDACPNAVIEAMACGLPIVASDVNGIPDIIEEGERSGGILVPPGNPRALTQALGRVFDNQALTRELGQRARRRAETSFSMEAIGKQLSSFLLNARQLASHRFF